MPLKVYALEVLSDMVATGQVLIGLCCLISFAVCALRFYMRVVVSRQFALLEFTLIFALITLGSLQIKMFEILAAIKTPEDAVRLNVYFFAGTFFYLTALWSVKISVNLLHIRLSTKIPETHVWAIRSLYFMVISLIGAYITFLLGCVPIHRRWDAPLGRAKSCPPIMREWDFWLHTALNIGTDIWRESLLSNHIAESANPEGRLSDLSYDLSEPRNPLILKSSVYPSIPSPPATSGTSSPHRCLYGLWPSRCCYRCQHHPSRSTW
ncbi:uncharacterized protein K441DRAFT_204101 [Cenococcum geophilum 1.58]|uniref:uncharacterized protein n=1 Tax=Cenococcum geophilum 1.58 TaxID=794803 RepID=UPI00358DF1BA|nr:hypothetical protein K441DRAFT_204101 [Cenococcum geophilum 1.58]